MKCFTSIGILLAACAVMGATQYTPGPWLLFISGTQQPGEYASAQACNDAVLKINAPPNITAGCRQSTKIKSVTLPPAPIDCVTAAAPAPAGNWQDTMTGTCLNDSQLVSQTRSLIVTTQPANGGKSCPVPLSETRQITRACTSTPPVKPVPQPAVPFTVPRIGVTGYAPSPSTDGTSAFRTIVNYSHMNYHDPIVFPGQPGVSHLHVYFGNACTDAYSTTQSLAACTGSTAHGGTVNKSSYWVPDIVDSNGVQIIPAYNQVYYKSGYNGTPPSVIKAIPNGIRAVAGESPTATAPSADPHHYFECYPAGYPTRQQYIPPCTGNGAYILMVVDFPQCWDGVNLDSPDHRSHLAYASNGCPSHHPVALPVISYNIVFPIPAGGNTDGWRLSSDSYAINTTDKRGGYSSHGDVWTNWQDSVEATWIAKCVSVLVDCHTDLTGGGNYSQGQGEILE